MPYALNGGVRIHFETTGGGPPLLLHHGTLLTGAEWFEFGYVEALRDQFQVIVVDAQGRGSSDKPSESSAYARPPCAPTWCACSTRSASRR